MTYEGPKKKQYLHWGFLELKLQFQNQNYVKKYLAVFCFQRIRSWDPSKNGGESPTLMFSLRIMKTKSLYAERTFIKENFPAFT